MGPKGEEGIKAERGKRARRLLILDPDRWRIYTGLELSFETHPQVPTGISAPPPTAVSFLVVVRQ
ncbi:hypothetical protein M413DRAFT_449917 [Hebeloma cylindrosporum]|uniref:Uncharacterized protein n=1 Tax=Hebeloma cylindrosporum TaxID=76867 RepID=A0A0C3BSI6_HEBCY|nr:hypothetical protein M413DRAFT_449917 [Hebeloma cylindrosporum h7]